MFKLLAIFAVATVAALPATAAEDNCFKIADAAYRGADTEVTTLIAQGANVNCQFSDGWTALMHAVYSKKKGTIQLLLKNGADPNQKRKAGVTALVMAKAHTVLAMGDTATKEMMELVAILEEAGAKD
jgi:ankyrin repeat protein